jgi:hypothetical protein
MFSGREGWDDRLIIPFMLLKPVFYIVVEAGR